MSATTINFQMLEKEYGYNEEDDDRLHNVKEAVASLSEPDRRIIHLYAEEGSMRKVASYIRVSPATAFHYIWKIREKIFEMLDDTNQLTDNN